MGQILFIGNVDFFSNFCVFSKFSGPKKNFSTLGSNGKNSLWTWTLLFCSLSFVMLDNTEKIGQVIFFTGIMPFFQNFVFSSTSQFLKKCSYNLYSNGNNSLWAVVYCSLTSITLDNSKENGPQTFVLVITARSWIVCFYRLLRSQWNDVIFCTINVKLPCGPL